MTELQIACMLSLVAIIFVIHAYINFRVCSATVGTNKIIHAVGDAILNDNRNAKARGAKCWYNRNKFKKMQLVITSVLK